MPGMPVPPMSAGVAAGAVAAGTLIGAVIVALVVHAVAFVVLRTLVERASSEEKAPEQAPSPGGGDGGSRVEIRGRRGSRRRPRLGGAGWRRSPALERALILRSRRPLRFVLPVVAVEVALPLTQGVPPGLKDLLLHAVGAFLIAGMAWLVIEVTWVLDDLLLERFSTTERDNLRARRIHTQVQVIRRVLIFGVVVVTAAIILLSFGQVRAIGASLLASAGLAGLVAGIAAQPILSNVMAGLQMAVTQPLRLDDVVVVSGYWGRVEEITLAYVVVQVWDQRRLVLPFSYFATNPFENWTRQTSDLLGTVDLDLDFNAPVDAMRRRLSEVLASSPNWDGRASALQVTDAGAATMHVRALVSAADASRLWDLRCQVREALIEFLRAEHPGALPRLRTEVPAPPTGPSGAPGSPSGSPAPRVGSPAVEPSPAPGPSSPPGSDPSAPPLR
jgi:small-conductance mechanosensitive channel